MPFLLAGQLVIGKRHAQHALQNFMEVSDDKRRPRHVRSAAKSETRVARAWCGARAVALFVALNVCDVTAVKSVSDGQRTVYSGSHLLSIFVGCFGLVIFVFGIFFRGIRGRFSKAVGMVLFLLSLLILALSPTGLNHCVIVTADGCFDRVGLWFAPRERTVDFNALSSIDLKEADLGRSDHRNYVLRCYPKAGQEVITVPLDDNLIKALPEIFRNAAKRGVIIEQNDQAFEDLFGKSK